MDTTTVTKTIQLYPKQKDFLSSNALFRGFAAGIGAGKSWVGAYDMIRRAKSQRLYMVVAPTYTLMADASFRSMEKVARDLDFIADGGIARGSTPYIKLKTGAEILFRSAHDPDMLRGPNLSGVWMDEASLMKQDAFDILIGRLREGGELGWLTATFTPKGKSHWTYKKFANAADRDVELFHAKTYDNPFLPEQFYATRRKQYSAQQAEQELGGVFLDGAGNHFMPGAWPRYIDIEDGSLSIPGTPRRIHTKSEYTIIITLDWAMGKKKKDQLKKEFLDDDGMKGDFTAFVVSALTNDGCLFILDVVNRRIRLEDNAPELARLCKQWKPYIVAGDDDMLSETMKLDCRRHRDIPEVRCLPIAGKDKRMRATAAIIHGENERIYLPQETSRHKYPWLEAFIDQLSGFTGIDDDHDDMVDALGIAGRLADELKGDGRLEPDPEILIPVADRFGW